VRELQLDNSDEGLATATRVLLALTVSKLGSFSSSLCIWRNVRSCVAQTFGRQALPMVWDFGEMNPFAGSAGDLGEAVEYLLRLVDHVGKSVRETGHCEQADAAASPLPSDSAALIATDPPYYNAVPYADLSDFFYVWLSAPFHK
jgi:putative DNA methylase